MVFYINCSKNIFDFLSLIFRKQILWRVFFFFWETNLMESWNIELMWFEFDYINNTHKISLIFINSIMRAHHSNIPFIIWDCAILFYFTKNARSTLIWVINLVRISINHMMLNGDTFTKICARACVCVFFYKKICLCWCMHNEIIPRWFFLF